MESSQGRAKALVVVRSGALVGCLGILCVLAMPALLFLPVETWGAPTWIILLAPLVAFGIVALGGWLLWRSRRCLSQAYHSAALKPQCGGVV
jgi:hypothetical protein